MGGHDLCPGIPLLPVLHPPLSVPRSLRQGHAVGLVFNGLVFSLVWSTHPSAAARSGGAVQGSVVSIIHWMHDGICGTTDFHGMHQLDKVFGCVFLLCAQGGIA